jgi:glycosyltransferase involved in cell wall biosynthesis
MKIAFMAYDKPHYFGGPIVNARRLLPELQRRGHDIHAIIFYDRESPTTPYLRAQGITCHSIERPIYVEDQIAWILKTLRRINPDIFVPNIFVSGWYAAKWVQAAGIPAIAAHRSDDPYYWGMVQEFVVGAPEWAISGLVCVSHHIKAQVEKLQPQHTRLCMIPSGVPIPQEPSPQTGPLKIVYVGRLYQPQKRIHETLEACIQVAQQLPEVTITLIGEGPERPALERRVQQVNLSEAIHFTGPIPNEALHAELVKHHVLVLLSDYEGTPGAVMDGMACGLVPVCSQVIGGFTELVIPEQTGLLVGDRGPSFLQAIQRLAQAPELRQRLAENARTHIRQHYSLAFAVDQWETLCQQLRLQSLPKQPLVYPDTYHLPPVRPELAHQDKRQPKSKLVHCLILFYISARRYIGAFKREYFRRNK